jgi:hypothetical protein
MKEKTNEKNNLSIFIKYFEETYIGIYSIEKILIKKPMFPIEFWNTHERVLRNLPRITNSVEAWHRSLNQKSMVSHPNICRFISTIQKEEELVKFNLIRNENGMLQTSTRNLCKEENLRVVVENYENFIGDGFYLALEKVFMWKFE